jgi:hypothetical protein
MENGHYGMYGNYAGYGGQGESFDHSGILRINTSGEGQGRHGGAHKPRREPMSVRAPPKEQIDSMRRAREEPIFSNYGGHDRHGMPNQMGQNPYHGQNLQYPGYGHTYSPQTNPEDDYSSSIFPDISRLNLQEDSSHQGEAYGSDYRYPPQDHLYDTNDTDAQMRLAAEYSRQQEFLQQSAQQQEHSKQYSSNESNVQRARRPEKMRQAQAFVHSSGEESSSSQGSQSRKPRRQEHRKQKSVQEEKDDGSPAYGSTSLVWKSLDKEEQKVLIDYVYHQKLIRADLVADTFEKKLTGQLYDAFRSEDADQVFLALETLFGPDHPILSQSGRRRSSRPNLAEWKALLPDGVDEILLANMERITGQKSDDIEAHFLRTKLSRNDAIDLYTFLSTPNGEKRILQYAKETDLPILRKKKNRSSQ